MGACRVYGSLNVNKVASNLHITSDGHGYGKKKKNEVKLGNDIHLFI